ncbi:MAG: GAF domain-containing protein [Chloroflexi bacterium]|nr:GAF domain-containing protein [Chloroflexota bacterium]
MNWQNINIIICLAAAMIFGYLVIYARQRRAVRGASWFAMLAFACAWVLLLYAFESLAGANLAVYLTFSKFEYVGLTFIPLAWLGFALHFSGMAWRVQRHHVVALMVIPLITITLAWTNEWHGLIWAQPRFDLSTQPPLFTPVYGVWFWVYLAYSYLVFLVGSLMLIRLALLSWRLHRAQAVLILIATVVPWMTNLLDVLDVSLIPGLYLVGLSQMLSVVLLAFALFRLHLLDVMPLAHDLILHGIPDGVIVVDGHNRVVTINRHVQPYLPNPSYNPLGQPLHVAFPKLAAFVEGLQGITSSQLTVRQLEDRTVQIKIAPVYDQHRQLRGRLFILTDITMQALAEKAVLDQYAFTEILHEFANRLSSTLELDRVMALIVESVGRVVPNDRADLMLVADDGHTLSICQHAPATPESEAVLHRQQLDYRRFATLAQAVNGPLVIPDTATHPDWNPEPDPFIDIRSYACAPIRSDGQLLGFISLVSATPDAFNPEIGDKLQVFADQASLGIKNARLYAQTRQQADELRRRVESLTILHRLYKDISFSFNVSGLLEVALDAAMRLCRADGAYLALVSDGVLQLNQFYGDYDPDRLTALIAAQDGITGHAIAERRALISLNPDSVISAMTGTRAQIALPLYTANTEGGTMDTLSGIMVMEATRQDRFTEDRFQLLVLLAGRVASALENARLVEAVRARAEELEVLYRRVSQLEHLKSDMIRIAAHDLKNPLHVLLGYMDDLVQEDPDATIGNFRRTFSAMQRAAERMKKIIEEILSLERIERLAEQQMMQPFDLRARVEEATAEFAERAAQKGLAFTLEIEPADYVVNGDTVQIYEAISNFISNAIKYTPAGGRVSVRLAQADGQLRLEVSDTGIGIPDDQQARLFEPFFRAKTKEMAAIEGTGLGLHLVKNIVERHGGRVIVQSVYQQGSTFGFELPIVQDDHERARHVSPVPVSAP